ncbi:MAG: hypothetical protein AAED33_07870 [Paracoccaceae bacterium]|jgi:hypothetical protein
MSDTTDLNPAPQIAELDLSDLTVALKKADPISSARLFMAWFSALSLRHLA